MASILNCRAIFSHIWKQQKADAKAFGSRSFKLCIDELLESTKFEKVKGSNIVKCVQKKYFSYIIDKFIFAQRKLFKSFGYPDLVFIVFVIIFINSIYHAHIPSRSFSKWAFSHLYRINIWKFGISMVNIKQMVREPMKYLTFLIYEQSSCTLSEENRMFIYSFKYPSKEI